MSSSSKWLRQAEQDRLASDAAIRKAERKLQGLQRQMDAAQARAAEITGRTPRQRPVTQPEPEPEHADALKEMGLAEYVQQRSQLMHGDSNAVPSNFTTNEIVERHGSTANSVRRTQVVGNVGVLGDQAIDPYEINKMIRAGVFAQAGHGGIWS